MKILFFITALVTFISCNQRETREPIIETARDSKFQNILTQYKDITFDTLEIFSASDPESQAYKFKGTRLDSSHISLFPKDLSGQYASDDGFFACFKFPIDNDKTGLITRTPSLYDASSIKLLIFDERKDSVTDHIELAETFGDAGDFAIKKSWIIKDEKGKYSNLIWYQVGHDNSADNEQDTTSQVNNYYYLLDIAKSKIDTLSKNDKTLAIKFATLLNAKANH